MLEINKFNNSNNHSTSPTEILKLGKLVAQTKLLNGTTENSTIPPS
jgi:hypothetical protein